MRRSEAAGQGVPRCLVVARRARSVVAERYRLNSRLVGLTLAMDTALSFLLLPVLIGVTGLGSVPGLA